MLPYTILALVLCYRLGGGIASQCRRLAYGTLLLMLSGLEDLAFLTINAHTDRASPRSRSTGPGRRTSTSSSAER